MAKTYYWLTALKQVEIRFEHYDDQQCVYRIVSNNSLWFQTTPHGELIEGWGVIF